MELKFFDANVIYGTPNAKGYLPPVHTIAAVQKEMTRAGVGQALVRRVEQVFAGAVTGNRLVADDVRGVKNLWGVWSILPMHTHEIPDPDKMPREMKKNRIACWQMTPAPHCFTFHYRALKDWLKLAQARNIPIFIDLTKGISLPELYNVLELVPKLTVIVSGYSVWPCDRLMRPLLAEFPNVYLELSNYIADQGIEDWVAEMGAQRLLFGSRFYECHFGQLMLIIKHARISEKDRALIAGGNLERILERTTL
jgi:predicted TIM-barrel fold metal-dependent hydrolase